MKFLKGLIGVGMMGLVFALAGCGGGTTVTDQSQVSLVLPGENFESFETEFFFMQYPRDWEIKDNSQVVSQFKDTVQAVFVSNFKDPFFTPVISVEAIKNVDGLGNPEFAEAFIKQNENSLISYREIERKSVPLNVGDLGVNSYLIRFQGKEKLSDDILEYLQVYLVKNEWGYVVTAAFDPNSEGFEVDKMVQALQTVRLK